MSSNLITADNGVSSGVTGITQSAGSDGTLQLRTTSSGGSAVTALTIDNSQKVTFANTIGFGSNAGITFNNSSALTNSTLNDYETGTWTPSVGGTATYIAQNGIYTKVGNIVSVKGTFTINAIGTGSTAAISGLPFTSATTTGSPTAQVVFGYWASLSTSVTYLGGYVNTSANTIYFVTTTGNQSTITNNPNVLQSGSRVDFSAVYQANF